MNCEENIVYKTEQNLHNHLQTKANSSQNHVVMVNKIRSVVSIIGIICFVILLFQIPIVLYYTDPSTVDVLTMLSGVDIKTCSVSYVRFIIHVLVTCHIAIRMLTIFYTTTLH